MNEVEFKFETEFKFEQIATLSPVRDFSEVAAGKINRPRGNNWYVSTAQITGEHVWILWQRRVRRVNLTPE